LLIRKRFDEGAKSSDLLILTRAGKQYAIRTHTMHLTRLYHQFGLTGCKSHSGRRFFITEMVRNGTNMKVAQILAGHSDAATTAKYYEASEEDISTAIKNIG